MTTAVLDRPGRPPSADDLELEFVHSRMELRISRPVARCHPERPMHAMGLCSDCYATRSMPRASNDGLSVDGARRTPLTHREMEVLDLVARGLSNEAIADELAISQKTTAIHVGHILAKLGLAGRVQVAVWYARHPLLRRGVGRPM